MDQSFFISDLVCRTGYDDRLEFGKVRDVRTIWIDPYPKNRNEEIEETNVESQSDAMDYGDNIGQDSASWDDHNLETETQIMVLWDAEKKRCTDENVLTPQLSSINPKNGNLTLVDRRFSIGQRVQRNGLLGTVIGFDRLVTFQVVGSELLPMVIPDVKLENIQPLTNLFHGVLVEFSGWVGQVTKVHRKVVYKSPNFPEFYTIEVDKRSCTSSKYIEHDDQIGFGYPYMPLSSDPYDGKSKSFKRSDLYRKAFLSSTDSAIQDEMCIELSNYPILCINVEVLEVTVNWMGRWPSHLPGKEDIPNATLKGSDLEVLHPLYINPSMYLDRNGICNCQSNDILTETKWMKGFLAGQREFDKSYDSEMGSSMDEANGEGTVRKYLVQKMFSRHSYIVKWDSHPEALPDSARCFGFELEPEDFVEYSLRFKPCCFCFCKRMVEGIGFAENEYGVAVEKSSQYTMMVQWLRILSDGSLKCAMEQLEECNILHLMKHPTFGNFSDNRVVVASKLAREHYKPLEFIIGTIVSIDRWDLGKIHVYCAIEKRMKTIWPHQIEIFKELSAKQRMCLRLRGHNT